MKLLHMPLSFLIGLFFIVGCSDDNTTVEPELVISVNQIKVEKEGITKEIYVKSNVDWTIQSDGDWCSVTPESGSEGTKSVSVVVNENTSTDSRNCTVTVAAGDLVEFIDVSQEKGYLLQLEQEAFDLEAVSSELEVKMETSDDFDISIDVDWIKQSILKSTKDSIVVFAIDENLAIYSRTGHITFTLNDIEEAVTITQKGKIESVDADITGVESDAETLAAKMIVGWNLGNSLEVPGGETLWGNPKVNKELIEGVKEAGFNAVRIPCAWDSYIVDEDTYQISDEWLNRVKEVVDYCYDADMYSIINIHWDGGWLEEHPLYSYQEEVNQKQYALWIQIATFFRDYDEHLLFAGTNEVRENYNTPSTENIEVQESYVQTFVDAVRATGGKNAYRNLVVQTYNTNIDHGINLNTMPVDVVEDRLILEAHYYDPYEFTIKTDDGYNTQWGQGYTDVSSWGQEDYLEAQFQKLKTKYIDNDIPVIIGEYSAMLRGGLSDEAQALHEESRNYYHAKINEVAKSMGITTFYWDNGYTTENASGLFNRSTGEAVHSNAIDAIINVYK